MLIPMSPRFWIGAAGGAMAGYCVGRLLEARANGVPLDLAFKRLLEPVAKLRTQIEQQAREQLERVARSQSGGVSYVPPVTKARVLG